MICSRCLLRSARNQIYYTSERSNSSQRSFVSSRSRFTSGPRPIRANRLVRARKRQIREVFISVRSRKRFALPPASDLRNRPFYHTNHRSSPAYSSQRYRVFRHTKCQVSLVANSTFARLFHLPSMPSSLRVKPAASAAILSDRTMACIATYEQSISTKRLAGIAVGSSSYLWPGAIFRDTWANGRRTRWIPYFFTCITNRFLMDGSHVPATRHNEDVVIFFVRWHLLR